MKLPENITTVIADLDGTVYLGNKPIDGAVEAIERLRRKYRVLFLTNNTSVSVSYYAEKLTAMGIKAESDDIITAGEATAYYIKLNFPKAKFYVVGTEEFKRELQENGIRASKNPDAVLLSFDTELNYEKLERACDLIRGGAKYIATHPDINCPKDGGFKPDIGSFMALIEASTGRRPDIICGKPYSPLILYLISILNESPQNILMTGDRLYTDMAFAKAAGFVSCLVLSGETTVEMLDSGSVKPDIIVGSIAELE